MCTCLHTATCIRLSVSACLPVFFLFFLVVLLYVHRFEVLLYVHKNRRLIRDGEPRTATSTFTQFLSSGSLIRDGGQLGVWGVVSGTDR